MSESDIIFTLLVIIFLMQVWQGVPREEKPVVAAGHNYDRVWG
jgi:hypothetical protein